MDPDRDRLAVLAVEWNTLCARRLAEGETSELSSLLQQVGSEILTLCHRLGLRPALVLLPAEGAA
jgi:hypothetical protein